MDDHREIVRTEKQELCFWREKNDCRRTQIRSKRGVGNCHALFVALSEEGDSRKHPCPMCILFQYMRRLWIKSRKLSEWERGSVFLFFLFWEVQKCLYNIFLPPFFFCKDLVKQVLRQIRYGSPETCFCCDPNKPCLRESFKLKWKKSKCCSFWIEEDRWNQKQVYLFLYVRVLQREKKLTSLVLNTRRVVKIQKKGLIQFSQIISSRIFASVKVDQNNSRKKLT